MRRNAKSFIRSLLQVASWQKEVNEKRGENVIRSLTFSAGLQLARQQKLRRSGIFVECKDLQR